MDLKTIDYDRVDAVVKLTLNRPKAMNSMNKQLMSDFFDAIAAIDEDESVRAVVVTGAGRAFCGGGDIVSFRENMDEISKFLKGLTTFLHGAISRMARMNAPVIAAVNGVAAGAGMSLALATDLAIAGESAKFTLAYTGIGATPDGSSTFFLPRIIGIRRTMELALLNRTLTAAEALDWGMVNRVVADDKVVEEAMALAQRLASGPTLAYGRVKRLVYTSLDNGLENQMEEETQAIAASARTRDFDAATAAFLAKERPTFEGR